VGRQGGPPRAPAGSPWSLAGSLGAQSLRPGWLPFLPCGEEASEPPPPPNPLTPFPGSPSRARTKRKRLLFSLSWKPRESPSSTHPTQPNPTLHSLPAFTLPVPAGIPRNTRPADCVVPSLASFSFAGEAPRAFLFLVGVCPCEGAPFILARWLPSLALPHPPSLWGGVAGGARWAVRGGPLPILDHYGYSSFHSYTQDYHMKHFLVRY
jgi:hypothetical protein